MIFQIQDLALFNNPRVDKEDNYNFMLFYDEVDETEDERNRKKRQRIISFSLDYILNLLQPKKSFDKAKTEEEEESKQNLENNPVHKFAAAIQPFVREVLEKPKEKISDQSKNNLSETLQNYINYDSESEFITALPISDNKDLAQSLIEAFAKNKSSEQQYEISVTPSKLLTKNGAEKEIVSTLAEAIETKADAKEEVREDEVENIKLNAKDPAIVTTTYVAKEESKQLLQEAKYSNPLQTQSEQAPALAPVVENGVVMGFSNNKRIDHEDGSHEVQITFVVPENTKPKANRNFNNVWFIHINGTGVDDPENSGQNPSLKIKLKYDFINGTMKTYDKPFIMKDKMLVEYTDKLTETQKQCFDVMKIVAVVQKVSCKDKSADKIKIEAEKEIREAREREEKERIEREAKLTEQRLEEVAAQQKRLQEKEEEEKRENTQRESVENSTYVVNQNDQKAENVSYTNLSTGSPAVDPASTQASSLNKASRFRSINGGKGAA